MLCLSSKFCLDRSSYSIQLDVKFERLCQARYVSSFQSTHIMLQHRVFQFRSLRAKRDCISVGTSQPNADRTRYQSQMDLLFVSACAIVNL